MVPDGSGGWRYEYFLKDHLGNTRAVVAGTLIPGGADVLQTTSYYPFGLVAEQTDYNTALANYRENRYLYNGKELQSDGFGDVELGWLDYGARMYDAAGVFWTTQDPLCQYDSPYVYVGNNPINTNDPTGMAGTSMTSTVIDPQNRVVYHKDDDDDNIYLSPDGKQGSDGNFEGLEPIAKEQPGEIYHVGYYLYWEFGGTLANPSITGHHTSSFAPWRFKSQGLENWTPEYDIAEIFFTAGGLILIKKGGKWLIKKFTKETAEELAKITAKSVDDKLARYLLNMDHPVGKSKAKWFKEALGFTTENADDLAKQIIFKERDAVMQEVTEHGTKYSQMISINGANGRNIVVQFNWIRNNDGAVKLVGAIPTKK